MSGETTNQVDEFRRALLAKQDKYQVDLSSDQLRRLGDYYELLLGWNSRLHLVAPCSPTEFATRHVLESLCLLPHMHLDARLADIGAGAGLPIIPNLVVRPDLQATIIEASSKKAVFLREALRRTGTIASVLAKRFENLPTPAVDYVTCRALERFTEMLPILLRWAPPASRLLLFAGETLRAEIESLRLDYSAISIPDSDRRFLFVIESREHPRP